MKKTPSASVRLRGVSYPSAAAIPPKVWLDNKLLKHDKSLRIWAYSIYGFGWGNNANGAAQLALAICLELYPKAWAVKVAPCFRAMFLDKIEGENFDLNLNLVAFNEDCIAQMGC